jgi:DNA polymerase (family 10)
MIPDTAGAFTSERIKRADAEAINKAIRSILNKFSKGYAMAGSYRRGHNDMGDIDFILIDANITSIISALMEKGLMFRIARHGESVATVIMKNKNRECQVEFNSTKAASFGAALLHSTGPFNFNIELRTYAKVKNWLLNQHGLYLLATNKRVAGKTEEQIFNVLGYKFIPPLDRDNGFWRIKDKYRLH